MTLRSVVIPTFAFAVGFFTHLLVSQVATLPAETDAEVADHWKTVNQDIGRIRDPDSYSSDSQAGLLGVEIPNDLESRLATLVAAGELEHVDLVLPLVPNNRETNLHWMQFVDDHQDEILWATGNPEYVDYKPAGESPLHLNLWFKETAKADIQRLVDERQSLSVLDG